MPLVEIYRMTTAQTYSEFTADDDNNANRLSISAIGNEAAFPDKHTTLQDIQFGIVRTQTDNPAPHQEDVKKPDTGFAGMTYTMRLMFMFGSQGLERLQDWTADANRVRRVFRHGRFGIRFDKSKKPDPYVRDDDPTRIPDSFDVHPTNNKGLKISSFEATWNPNNSSVVGTLVMELSGGS